MSSYSNLPVRPVYLALVLLSFAVAAHAACSDTRCPRFYNAECREEACESPPCTASYFWRGRNITHKCNKETCDDKDCTSTRRCVEEIVTTRNGRQIVIPKCKLIEERPRTCSDITCDPGEVCRLRDRGPNLHPVVRCVEVSKQTSCENLNCEPGFSCLDEGNQVVCIPDPTTERLFTEESTTRAPATEDFTTQEPATERLSTQETTTEDEFTTERPGVSFAQTCAELNCVYPQVSYCENALYFDYNISIAQCGLGPDYFLPLIEAGANHTCDNQPCRTNEACITSTGPEIDTNTYCSRLDCAVPNTTICSFGSKCVPIPQGFDFREANSTCIPDEVDFFFGMSCDSGIAELCKPNRTCADSTSHGQLIGSYCTPYPTFSLTLSCTDLNCQTGTTCVEGSYESVPDFVYSYCLDITTALLLLELAGLIEPSTTSMPIPASPTPPDMVSSCDQLECSNPSAYCQLLVIPQFNLSVASCQTQDDLREFETAVTTNPDKPCELQTCAFDEVCVSYDGENIDAGGYCSRINCDPTDNTTCPADAKCSSVAANFTDILGDYHCIPTEVNVRFGVSCASTRAPRCLPNTYCTDVSRGDDFIGSYCSPLLSGIRTCDEIECDSASVCTELTYENRPSMKLATCIFIGETTEMPTTAEVTIPTKTIPDQETTTEDEFTTERPGVSFAQTCAELNCVYPQVSYCENALYFDYNISIAQCGLGPDYFLSLIEEGANHTCDNQPCRTNEVCITSTGPEIDTNTYCSRLDCAVPNTTICSLGSKCVPIPQGFDIREANSTCIPDEVDFFFGMSCDSGIAELCKPNRTCADSTSYGQLIGSYCTPYPTFSFTLSCTDLNCQTGTTCVEGSYESVPDFVYSYCLDITTALLLLELAGLIEPSTTSMPIPASPTPPDMVSSCDQLECSNPSAYCQLLVIPQFNLSVASCQTQDDLREFETAVTTNPDKPCELQTCAFDEVCVSYDGENIDAGGYCSRINCDPTDNTTCPADAKCSSVAANFTDILGDYHCIPTEVNVRFGVSCASTRAPRCLPNTYCTDVSRGDDFIGSYCSPLLSGIRTCDEIECDSASVCTELTYENRPSTKLSTCVFIGETTEMPTTTEVTVPPKPMLRAVATSCEDLVCPSSLPLCQLTKIPGLNATVAECTSSFISNFLREIVAQDANNTCKHRNCRADEVCIEYSGELIDPNAYCSRTNCSDNSTCPFLTRCVEVTSGKKELADSLCIPDDIVSINFDVKCESRGQDCDLIGTCGDATAGEVEIGSFCSALPTSSTRRRCSELKCLEGFECNEISFSDMPGVHFSTCTSINASLQLIQQSGGCETLQCPENQQCITNEIGRSVCIESIISNTCDNFECFNNTVCSVFRVPSDPSIPQVALCSFDLELLIGVYANLGCANLGSLICGSSACLEGVQSGRTVASYCTGCEEGQLDSCINPGHVCGNLPSELAALTNATTMCLDNHTETGVDCKSRMKPCPRGLYCTEAKLGDTTVATFCENRSLYESCEDFTCHEQDTCVEVESGDVQYATCTPI